MAIAGRSFPNSVVVSSSGTGANDDVIRNSLQDAPVLTTPEPIILGDALTHRAVYRQYARGTANEALLFRSSLSAQTNAVIVADFGHMADALTANVAAPLADTSTMTDNLTVNAAVALADHVTMADAINVIQKATAISLADTMHLTDAIHPNAAVTVHDTGHLTDAIHPNAAVTLHDTGHLTDRINVATSALLVIWVISGTVWVQIDAAQISGGTWIATNNFVLQAGVWV